MRELGDDNREWERAPVGSHGGRSDWSNSLLESVSHVAHVDAAVAIVRDGKIRAGLVYDESKLRRKRICVTWFSPNDWWADGFRYGHVRFEVKWRPLIDGLTPYWVERVPHYRPNAYRFLFSANDRTRSGLRRYRPARDRGPWTRRQSEHRWNGRICLEAMVERDVPLRSVGRVSFVQHHRDMCSIDDGRCVDRRLSASAAGARFLACLVGNEVACPQRLLPRADPSVRDAAEFLVTRLADNSVKSQRGILSTDDCAPALARAVFAAYGRGSRDDVRALSSRFRSRESLIRAVRAEFARQRGWTPRADQVGN